ncbi:hypothetical protein [Parapedobacter sp. 2B3]
MPRRDRPIPGSPQPVPGGGKRAPGNGRTIPVYRAHGANVPENTLNVPDF